MAFPPILGGDWKIPPHFSDPWGGNSPPTIFDGGGGIWGGIVKIMGGDCKVDAKFMGGSTFLAVPPHILAKNGCSPPWGGANYGGEQSRPPPSGEPMGGKSFAPPHFPRPWGGNRKVLPPIGMGGECKLCLTDHKDPEVIVIVQKDCTTTKRIF